MIVARPRPLPLAPLLLALLAACGDSVGTTSDTQASATSTTSTATTDGATATTDGATSTATTDGATATATSTTADTTTTTTTTTTTASTTTTTTGESTTDGATSTTTGGSLEDLPCVDDADCTLLDTCCACDPHHVDQEVPLCDIDCDQSACSAAGLAGAKAICRVGRCTFEKVPCNPLYVSCKALPPECPPGTVPGVDGECWSGACVLAEACDWVPECSACDAPGLTCVPHLQKGAYALCEPLPFECGEGPATCACAGAICEASPPWTVCLDVGEGIACECPFC